jgi:GNAT superfamily N-acetyltransferase
MTLRTCPTGRGPAQNPADRSTPSTLAVWVRQPWLVRAGSEDLLIRGATPRDLPRTAAMHANCSPRSLLERYRAGGKAPSPIAIDGMLRRSLSFVACTNRGEIVATALVAPDALHPGDAAEIGILVRDDRQRKGLGRELLTHLSAAAQVCGYTQLITYTATSTNAAHRLLVDVGRTYVVPDPSTPHLHTYLSEASSLGLGPVREHLAS